MATPSMIGALRVVLGADTATLEKDFKRAQNVLSKFDDRLKAAAGRIGLSLTAAAGSIAALTKVSASYAAGIDDTSQRLGINVEKFQELSFAASLAGVSQEGFSKAMEQMNRRLGEVKAGVTGAETTLAKLGLSLNDIRNKSPDEAFKLIAERVSQIPNPMQQAAIASELFGRSGVKLLPVLQDGAAGLDRMAAEARRLGLVLSTETIKQAAEADDEFDRIGKSLRVAGVNITSGFLPALTAIREIVTSQQFQTGIKDLGTNLGIAIKWMVDHKDAVVATAGALTGLLIGTRLGGAGGGMAGALIGVGLASQSATTELNKLDAQIAQIEAEMEQWKKIAAGEIIPAVAIRNPIAELRDLESLLEDLQTRRNQIAGVAPVSIVVTKPGAAQEVRAVSNALDDFFKSQQKAIATQQADAAAVGLATGARERFRLVMQAETIARQNNIAITDQQRVKMTELALAAQQAALQMEGRTLIEQALPAWQQYQLQVDNARLALESVGATSQQIAAVTQMMAERAGQTWQQQAISIAGGFKDLFTEMGKHGESWGEFAKALGIVEALINTYTAFTKALVAAPPPLNYALAAATLAAGMAKVMAIRSQKIPKMAKGGQFTVPGGMSMTDNKFVPLHLAAGERVTVEPANKVQERSVAPVQEIVLRSNDEWTLDRLRLLLDALNRAAPDGYLLRAKAA